MIEPLYNNIVLEEIKQDFGGLKMPDNSKDSPTKATVMAIGPGKLMQDGSLTPMPMNVGDVVIIKKFGSEKLTIDNKEYLFASSDDILAVLKS